MTGVQEIYSNFGTCEKGMDMDKMDTWILRIV